MPIPGNLNALMMLSQFMQGNPQQAASTLASLGVEPPPPPMGMGGPGGGDNTAQAMGAPTPTSAQVAPVGGATPPIAGQPGAQPPMDGGQRLGNVLAAIQAPHIPQPNIRAQATSVAPPATKAMNPQFSQLLSQLLQPQSAPGQAPGQTVSPLGNLIAGV